MARPGDILRGRIRAEKWEPADLRGRPARGSTECRDEYARGYTAAIEDVLRLLEGLRRKESRPVQGKRGESC